MQVPTTPSKDLAEQTLFFSKNLKFKTCSFLFPVSLSLESVHPKQMLKITYPKF
jgi:hypothetical protein